VVIRDFYNADSLTPHYGAGDTHPVVALNCSQPSCGLDGVEITGGGVQTHVAIRVYSGSVRGATILGSGPSSRFRVAPGTYCSWPQRYTHDMNCESLWKRCRGPRYNHVTFLGARIARAGSDSETYEASGVLDAEGLPIGDWKQSSDAGWALAGSSGSVPALSFTVQGAPDGWQGHSQVYHAPCIFISFQKTILHTKGSGTGRHENDVMAYGDARCEKPQQGHPVGRLRGAPPPQRSRS
jgi:hypothetical protein